jgi:uncharacterized protein YdeI (YjbR/CyaY-like superfamily)
MNDSARSPNLAFTVASETRNPESSPDGLPVLQPGAESDWEGWLDAHHADGDGVWLKLGKKGCPFPSISHATALQTALCFGWIDGQVRGAGEHFTLRRFTPRRTRSKWSQINCAHAERLIAEGRMRPAGLAQVQAAQADGRWDAAYAPPSTIEVPADLRRALDDAPAAAEFFAALKTMERYAYLYRLHHVTDPARRAARIEEYIARLGRRETL